MRLLIDMNLSPKWVGFLGEAGFEAQHWSAIGTVTADDAIILAHAKAGGWVILTNDLDFGAILAASGGMRPERGPDQVGQSGDKCDWRSGGAGAAGDGGRAWVWRSDHDRCGADSGFCLAVSGTAVTARRAADQAGPSRPIS